MFRYNNVEAAEVPSESRDLAERAMRKAELRLDLPRGSRSVRWFRETEHKYADFRDQERLAAFHDSREPDVIYLNAERRGASIVRAIGHEMMHSRHFDLGLRGSNHKGRGERAAREFSGEFVDAFYPYGSQERSAEAERIRADQAADDEGCRGFFGTDDWLAWLTATTAEATHADAR
jgi:hypothetical protein